MWVDLPAVWIVILNFTCIPAVQLGLSWAFTRLPADWFQPRGVLFRERGWEDGGTIYERLFGVRLWKDWLPDGAPWVSGFSKKNLAARDPGYVREFMRETCRGEMAHVFQMPGVLLTLAWNPWPVAAGIILLYAVLSNLPCIIVQRHTRARLARLLARIAPH